MLQFLTLRNKISKDPNRLYIYTATHKAKHCYKPRWSSGAGFYSQTFLHHIFLPDISIPKLCCLKNSYRYNFLPCMFLPSEIRKPLAEP